MRLTITFILLVTVLGLVAAVAPPPIPSDRDFIEHIGRHPIDPGCHVLNCFRIVVPWVMVRLPGDALMRWRLYAVATNAAAAVAAGQLGLMLGVSPRAASYTIALSAFGSGSLATIYHPYTADPLMYLLAPIILMQLLMDRIRTAAVIGACGIFAKEFAAAPLWIVMLYNWLEHRRAAVVRTLAAASLVTLTWIAIQEFLILGFQYTYAGNPSTRLLSGGYVRVWFAEIGAKAALAALFSSYGALYLLMPVGVVRCGRRLRQLAVASIPGIVAFAYVETPERALWNFYFLAIPLAAVVLIELPTAAAWIFVVGYGGANLKLGAQLPFAPPARFPLVVSLMLAAAALFYAWRNSSSTPTSADWPVTRTNSA